MTKDKFALSLFFFRRELRLQDNSALISALQSSHKVLPVFCLDPRQCQPSINSLFNSHSYSFMIQSLNDLSNQLIKNGGKLYVFREQPHKLLNKLVHFLGIKAVYANLDYTPFARERDRLIQEQCVNANIPFHTSQDQLLVPLKNLPKDFKPYKVFTHFYNKVSSLHVKKVQKIQPLNLSEDNWFSQQIAGTVSIPNLTIQEQQQIKKNGLIGGRSEALKRLSRLPKNYEQTRDFPAEQNGTSCLSAYLKFGCLSVRQVFYEAKRQLKDSDKYIRQLYWREFAFHIHMRTGFQCFNPKYKDVKWPDNEALFAAWKQGRTGYPIVDAAMRKLGRTGLIHNRCRMIVASFLVKDLLIDWRWGERYFAQVLTDYDPILNNMGWQWVAGTGCDAQPYFRVFNPSLQSERFDGDCVFIKKNIPELEEVPSKHIHYWPEFAHLHPGTYMQPIINHAEQKDKALRLFGYDPDVISGRKSGVSDSKKSRKSESRQIVYEEEDLEKEHSSEVKKIKSVRSKK